jgi:hypothetical protein
LRAFGGVLIGLAALFVARAVVFVPEASACNPGFKPKPGVTNPTDNARDCEPESAPASPPPPPGGTVASPEPERPKKPPIVSPSDQRKNVEDRLRKGSKDGERSTDASGPKAPPQGRADGLDAAIERLGKKLEQDGERAEEPKVSTYPLTDVEVDQLVRALIVAGIIEAERRERLASDAEALGLVCSDPNCAERQKRLDSMAEELFFPEVLRGMMDAAAAVREMREMADGIDKGQLPSPTHGPTQKREKN